MQGLHRRLVRRRNPHNTPAVISTAADSPTPTPVVVVVPQTTNPGPGGATSTPVGVKSSSSPSPSSGPTILPSGSKTATVAASVATGSQASQDAAADVNPSPSSSHNPHFSGLATASNNPGSGNTSSPNSIDGSNVGSSANSTNPNKFSGGVIFAIVFFSLVLGTALIVFILRRRNMTRRQERRKRWFGVGQILGRFSGYSEHATTSSGTNSARSSFATNTDRGHLPFPDFQALTIPPMAELRQSISHADVPIDMLVNLETGSNRSSVSSSFSVAQYISMPDESNHNPKLPTPMTVSPFITTETFAFPQPPLMLSTDLEASIAEDTGATSRWLSKSRTPSPVIGLPALALIADIGYISSISPSPAQAPNIDSIPNPFVDPQEDDDPVLGSTQTVRRDFDPTLGDELAVVAGDQVAIRKIFDDGWAYVERGEDRGLVPIDCLSEGVQHSLTAKRVSSHGFAM